MNTTTETLIRQTTPKESVKEDLQLVWKIHWISFSVLFSVIACYSVVLLIMTIRRASELTRNYRLAVFSLIITLCVSRTLYLIFSPYDVVEALVTDTPRIVQRLIYGLGQPSLTAGFGLIHASFLKVSKIRQYREAPILKTKLIMVIIVIYFTFGMIAEVTSILLPDMYPMLAVSCAIGVVGCTIVTVTVIYSGMKILRTATKNKRVLSKGALRGSVSSEQLVRAKSVAKVAKIMLLASTFCTGLTIANSVEFVRMVKKMVGVTESRNTWQNFTFVSSVRILELAMACTMLYALSRNATESTALSLLRRFTKKLKKSPSQSFPSKSHVRNNDSVVTPGSLSTSSSTHALFMVE